MSSRKVQYGVFAVIAIVVLAIVVVGIGSLPTTAQSKESGQQAPKQNDKNTPVSMRAALPPMDTAEILFIGFPSSVANDPVRRFDYAKDCAKFRSFDNFFRENAADPNWPLNNPKALAAAEPERREKLLKISRFLEEHRQPCAPWLEANPQDLENAQVYRAALEAGLHGDQNAAACFVLAAWQEPMGADALHPSKYYADVAKSYSVQAPRFVEMGLKAGNWPIAIAAYSASREEHGMRTSLNLSPQDKYLLARLLQMGAPDALSESEYGYVAASVARDFAAGEMVALDQRASDMFKNQFKGETVAAQSVADMCMNVAG